MSFCFGLVHGFGFASAIEPLQLPARRLALALLGFNLGVETGQALVVVLLLPLLLWMRGSGWEPRIVRAASLGVAAFGLVWLVERLVSSSGRSPGRPRRCGGWRPGTRSAAAARSGPHRP